MGILRSDRVSGLGGANAINGSVFFSAAGGSDVGGPYLITPDSDDFSFGSGEFTIEFWIRKQNNGLRVPILAQQAPDGSSDDYGCWIEMNADHTIEFQDQTSGVFASTGTISNDTWTHVALVRDGNTLRWFIGGVASGTKSESGSMKDSAYPLSIGKWGEYHGSHATNLFYFEGFLSNLRIQKGKAEYTSAFTPPTTRLEKTSDTVLLCCQSPGNVEQEATGKILQAVAPTNGSPPKASRLAPDVGEDHGTTFADNTKFDSLSYMVPPGGTTTQSNRGRGLFMGGYTPTPTGSKLNTISYIDIASSGHDIDFGDLTQHRFAGGAFSSSTRGILGGGRNPSRVDTIDYVTIAITANAIDFGNLSGAAAYNQGASNVTRGMWFGGSNPPNQIAQIDYVTIATLGNGGDFGDLTDARHGGMPVSSTTRAVCMGGHDGSSFINIMDYITIATTGNATDFGDMPTAYAYGAGVSNGVRGLIGGGGSGGEVNHMDYITIATTGNSNDFGDLIYAREHLGAVSNSTRGVWFGGVTPTYQTDIQYAIINTLGNTANWGDLYVPNGVPKGYQAGSSDSHGGIA